MHDTIALVGRAPGTRHWIDRLPEDVPIYSIAACWDIVPRDMAACVEIHHHAWITHPRYSPPMYEWMRQPHPFPIYTQAVYPDVPASVLYPYEKVLALAGVYRVSGEDWQERINEYFTSSYDYLIGLAILADPRRIISVGYDMASDTEYRYQREGAAFWLGVAAGRGIGVFLPDECPILSSALYGYAGSQTVSVERVRLLGVQAAGWVDEAQERRLVAINSIPSDPSMISPDELSRLRAEADDALDHVYMYSGVVQACDQLVREFSLDDVVTRQGLERLIAGATETYNKLWSFLNFWEGVVRDRQQTLEDNAGQPEYVGVLAARVQEASDQLLKTRADFMTWKGGIQTLRMLLDECDLVFVPDWRPIQNMKAVEVTTETAA